MIGRTRIRPVGGSPARLLIPACVIAVVLAGCSSSPTPAPPASESPSPVGTSTQTDPSSTPSAVLGPTTGAPTPATGGVVPADPDGFAAVVARSVVAVATAGKVEFIDRILNDAHSSSSCVPVPDIKVRSRAQLDTERGDVRNAVRTARALEGIDGVGTARGRMQPGVEWPGVRHPFVVDVVIAVDCPDA